MQYILLLRYSFITLFFIFFILIISYVNIRYMGPGQVQLLSPRVQYVGLIEALYHTINAIIKVFFLLTHNPKQNTTVNNSNK